MAENKMFCFQCQETAKGTGCTIKGVCGKEATTSKWQDLLLSVVRGIGTIQHSIGKEPTPEVTRFLTDALFTTITNANFNDQDILQKVDKGIVLKKQLLQKAASLKGLTHREAAVLLDCDLPEENEKMYRLAEQIKKDFYGNRIVMFAPLYLSNYCVNGCTYCPYHYKNKHICRKKLTQEEVEKEVIALQDLSLIHI